MASEYQLTTPDPDGPVLRLADNAHIPADPGNKDWQEYQQWLAEGGVPDSYVPPPEPEPAPLPLEVAHFNFSGRPAANAMVQIVAAIARTIPVDLAGSQGYCQTKPKGSPAFTLMRAVAGVDQRQTYGVVTFNPDGTVEFAGPGGQVDVGEVLQVTAPSSMDQTLADVAISIVGT